MKRITKSAAETDAFSRWGRRHLCYIQRPGVRSSIKRMARRRDRRDAKAAIREARD